MESSGYFAPMMTTKNWSWILLLLGSVAAETSISAIAAERSGKYSFLDQFDKQPRPFIPEKTDTPEEPSDTLSVRLDPFYRDFEADRNVSFFVGYGYQSYYPERARQIMEMLKVLGVHYGLTLEQWSLTPDNRVITFRNARNGINYKVTVENERDAYARAFSEYDVVIYHGHSRYGQGPAFDSFQNYFRMGRNFETIEVDTRNRYFAEEPIQKTDIYPLYTADLNGRRYLYQYRGGRDYRSELSQQSFTVNIPGKDLDLRRTRFLQGKQLFYFYSCKNREYFRESLRDLFPDVNHKAVIGTYRDGHGSTKPDALMIMSVVRHAYDSVEVVNELNETGDCDKCFTSY